MRDALKSGLFQNISSKDRPRLDAVLLQILYDSGAIKQRALFDDHRERKPRGRGLWGLDRRVEKSIVCIEKLLKLYPILLSRLKEVWQLLELFERECRGKLER